MTRKIMILLLIALLSYLTIQNTFAQEVREQNISGEIVGGLRLLSIEPKQVNDFVIYRGDYIQPSVSGQKHFTIEIPDLKITKTFPANEGERAYIKMKKPGSYDFTAGTIRGTIKVIEYTATSYTELSAEQAGQVLQNTTPLILDVRTPGEFKQGYIQGANLLPVQVIQQHIKKLESHKDQDIFIYCATGNRSTVASRILIKSGFKKIYNLRYGISDWAKRGYPVVQ